MPSPFPPAHLSAIDFEDGLITLDSAGTMRVFDALGAALWHALAEGHDPSALIADIAAAQGRLAGETAYDLIRMWNEPPAADGPFEPLAPTAPPRQQVRWHANLCGLHLAMSAEPQQADWLSMILPEASPLGHETVHRIAVVPAGGRQQALVVEDKEILRTDEPDLLQGAIYQACLDIRHGYPDWRAIMHGAAVALGNAAVGLPAPSGSGKSTLTALLLARGYAYLADDLLAVLPDGSAAPWPTAISVKPGSLGVIEEAWPSELAAAPRRVAKGLDTRMLPVSERRCAAAPVRLRALVMPRYEPEGDNRLTPITSLDALAELARDRLWIGYPLTLGRITDFTAWLAQTPCYMIRYNSVDRVDEALRAILEGDAA